MGKLLPILDNYSQGKGGGSSTLSWSHTIGNLGNNGLIVVASHGREGGGQTDPEETQSISFNGVAMTKIWDANIQQTGGSLYYIKGSQVPAAGTYTVTITYKGTGTPDQSRGICASFRSIKDVPVEAYGYETAIDGGGGNRNASVTPLTPNALVVAMAYERTDVSWSQTSSLTLIYENQGSPTEGRLMMFYKVVSVPTSTTLQINFTNPEDNGMVIASFEAANAGGGALFGMM